MSKDVSPPQKIQTVEHKAWQALSFKIPRAVEGKIIKKVRERLANGVYKHC